MTLVRVIGVGTAYGDDRAGLEVAARLRAGSPHGCEVVSTERPGAELVDLLRGADAVVIIDAVRSGAAPGTVHDRPLEGLDVPRSPYSSHGIGVGDAVALASALGQRPRGRFVGIEAGAGVPSLSTPLHPVVAAAIDPLVHRVRSWMDYFRDPNHR